MAANTSRSEKTPLKMSAISILNSGEIRFKPLKLGTKSGHAWIERHQRREFGCDRDYLDNDAPDAIKMCRKQMDEFRIILLGPVREEPYT